MRQIETIKPLIVSINLKGSAQVLGVSMSVWTMPVWMNGWAVKNAPYTTNKKEMSV